MTETSGPEEWLIGGRDMVVGQHVCEMKPLQDSFPNRMSISALGLSTLDVNYRAGQLTTQARGCSLVTVVTALFQRGTSLNNAVKV